MKILVVNGANINLIGVREKHIYGDASYAELKRLIRAHCKKQKIAVKIFQSNHEGEIIDIIQKARGKFDALVLNAGGYAHTSICIADALRAVEIPCAEVHISDTGARENYRRFSFVSEVAKTVIAGKGVSGYIQAIDFLKEYTELNGRADKGDKDK